MNCNLFYPQTSIVYLCEVETSGLVSTSILLRSVLPLRPPHYYAYWHDALRWSAKFYDGVENTFVLPPSEQLNDS